MSFAHLLRMLVRHWAILLVGMIATGGAVYLAAQERPTYFARAEVVFLAPSSQLYPNSLQTRSEDLIITAGLVAKKIMGADEWIKFGSPLVTLAEIPSTGSDYWVRLPDSGGQWAPHFQDQLLYVDVVGDTPADVRSTQAAVIDRIEAELDALQREQDVAAVNDITVTVAPEVTVVQELHGSRIRAMGMTALLGLAATAGAIIAVEIALKRRAHARVRAAQTAMAHVPVERGPRSALR